MPADDRTTYYGRTAGLAAASTLVLTASFVGVLSIVEGEFSGLGGRVPWYLVVTSLFFLGTIFVLEEHGASDGREIIAISAIVGLLSFVVTTLAVEGVVFAFNHPEDVFVSQTVLYFLAAGLFGTGIGYWGIKHWREFTDESRQPSQL